jgi:glycosyltransferase involved in cell wall biosynthesis
MNILQVVSYFVPAQYYGGPARGAYEISRELMRRGHKVTVYTSDSLDARNRIQLPPGNTIEMDGIKVRYFKNLSNWLGARHRLFLTTHYFSAVRDHLREFDVVHIHEYRTLQNIAVHYHAKRYNIPYVLQPRGSLGRMAPKQRLKQVYDALWGYKLLKDASKVLALTKTEVEQCKSMGVSEDKIEIIPNGIDVSAFGDLPKSGEFRVKYGLKDNQKIILYLGRIYWIKGLDLLANAFASISKDFSEAKLVIAGADDGYLPALKKAVKELEIEEKVLFTGPLYGKDKLEAYVDADVYILPSIYETFPMTVLEACACGTPVVVTDRCGIADIINGQVGLVVPHDRNQLSDAILRMLTDDKMRQQFGEKGKALVRQKFDWSKIVEQLEDVYQDVLTKGSTGKKGN